MAMTKWEYRVVTYSADALEQELNRVGAEGWEVIGTQFDRLRFARPSAAITLKS